MNCPRCDGSGLREQRLIGKIDVDYCPECNGMYFDKGEMGSYLRFSKDLPNYAELLAAGTPSIPCPSCATTMKEIRYVPGKDLDVDLCEACGGIWLDAGEASSAKQVAEAQDDRKIRLLRSIWEMRAAVRGEQPGRCPECKTQSVHEFETSEAVTLDMCDHCKGLWFDAGEIARYMELSADLPDREASLASARPTELSCPKCDDPKMVELDFAQIETPKGKLKIDHCPDCAGFWLDGGEVLELEYLATQVEAPGARLGKAVKELEDEGYMIVGMV